MRHPARRKALLVGAICGVALLGAAVAFREEIAFHSHAWCHAWRIERALTPEAAQPWLDKLEDDIRDPFSAQRLVAMLGPRWPRLTFWAFWWLHVPTHGLRHFARSLEDRARRDEGFRAVMAHFMRWNEGFFLLKERSFLSMFDGEKRVLLRREPAVQEAVVRGFEAWLLAEAWLFGMSPIPPPVELSFPLSEADMDGLFRRWEDLQGWVWARRERLRFDPALGRFVEVPVGQGSLSVPVPAEPLPGWTGPVPRFPAAPHLPPQKRLIERTGD